MSGKKLVYFQLLLLGLICLLPNLVFGFDQASIHWAIVISINIAIPWFLLAVSARPLAQVWPSKISRWTLKNRRYLGINWGVSFLTHGVFIILSASLYPEPFFAEIDWGTVIGGSFVFFVSTLMLVTSNNASVNFLGKSKWKALHTVGGYVILITLLHALLILNIHKPWLWPVAVLTLLVFVLRVVMGIKRTNRH